MDKLRAFADYVTKDQTPPEPEPEPEVKKKSGIKCAHCGAPDVLVDGCEFCGVVPPPPNPGLANGFLTINDVRSMGKQLMNKYRHK